MHPERSNAEINTIHMAKLILRAEAAGLLTHILNELGPLNSLRKARKILDQSRERQLAPRLMALEHQWL